MVRNLLIGGSLSLLVEWRLKENKAEQAAEYTSLQPVRKDLFFPIREDPPTPEPYWSGT